MPDRNDDRLAFIEGLFHAVRGLPVEDRAAFLDRACGDDAEVRREVEALVGADTETIGPEGRLRRLGILHAEGEDYAKMSSAPLALADWAVDRILAGVRRRPQWDEREFEDFLNGDT